jgi:hypothetical protein
MPIGQATGLGGEPAGEAFSLRIAAWLYGLPLDMNYLGEKAPSPAPKRSLFFLGLILSEEEVAARRRLAGRSLIER